MRLHLDSQVIGVYLKWGKAALNYDLKLVFLGKRARWHRDMVYQDSFFIIREANWMEISHLAIQLHLKLAVFRLREPIEAN